MTIRPAVGSDPKENAALQYWLAFELLRTAAPRIDHDVDNATTDHIQFGFGVPVSEQLRARVSGDVERAIRHLYRAAKLPYCEWGTDLRKDGPRVAAPYGGDAHQLARYPLLQARWQFEQSQWSDGIHNVMATMVMARHIGRDKIWFNVHYGCMIENMCVSTAAVYLPRMPDLAREDLLKKLAALPTFTTMREVVEHYEDATQWMIDTVKHTGPEELSDIVAKLLSPDAARMLFQCRNGAHGVEQIAREANRLRPECLSLLSLRPDDFVREFNARIQPRVEANPLLGELGPFYRTMRHEECTAACRLAMLKAGIDVLRTGENALEKHPDAYGDGSFACTPFEGGFNLCSDLVYGEAGHINLDFGTSRN
jgi:hypothetical protein